MCDFFPWMKMELLIIFDLLPQFNRTIQEHCPETTLQNLAFSDLTIPNTSMSKTAGAANWEHAAVVRPLPGDEMQPMRNETC